jgi:hypothetical protein
MKFLRYRHDEYIVSARESSTQFWRSPDYNDDDDDDNDKNNQPVTAPGVLWGSRASASEILTFLFLKLVC